MKTIIIAITLWMIIHPNVFSQKATTWTGGTPGMKNDWYCPYNWNTSSVPDEFSDVIIPDVSTTSLALPVLPHGQVEVNSINIHPNASLTIAKEASLVVLGISQGNIQKTHGEEELQAKNEDSMMVKKLLAESIE